MLPARVWRKEHVLLSQVHHYVIEKASSLCLKLQYVIEKASSLCLKPQYVIEKASSLCLKPQSVSHDIPMILMSGKVGHFCYTLKTETRCHRAAPSTHYIHIYFDHLPPQFAIEHRLRIVVAFDCLDVVSTKKVYKQKACDVRNIFTKNVLSQV